MLFRFLVFFLILFAINSCRENVSKLSFKSKEVIIDKIFEDSKSKLISIETKNSLLDSADNYIASIINDTIKFKYYSKLSLRYYKIGNYPAFKKLNSKTLKFAEKNRDSINLANSYWDLGNYYFDKQFVNDSAYYCYSKAQKIYEKTNRNLFSARMLYSMSRVQSRVKDNVRSEVVLSKAIPIFKSLNKYQDLYNCYNNLGIINDGLGEYLKAIEYYDVALKYSSKMPADNDLRVVRIINNKGVTYKNLGDYKAAIENYEEALKYDSLHLKSPKLYSFLLDNNAYSKFKLGDTISVSDSFFTALKIRDSLSFVSDIATSKLHLAEYFAFKKDTAKAVQYALESNELAKESGNNENLLDSYLLLADLDNERGVEYTKRHIALNDSLQKEERRIRNKFARIQFETEEIVNRNQQLSKQRYWITALLAATVLVALLGWIIFSQRSRNKALEFERMQQRTNEEIYSLMLAQQTKLEEGSQREKKRVSEELHDGILGRMFGTRLSLGSLNEKDDPESKKTRQLYLEELKSIEEEVRSISHELSNAMFNSERSYIAMVSELLETQSKVTDFDYTVDSDYSIDWDHVSGDMKINLYRIIQESVQNINKYAKASKVTINFEKIENSFVLSINDDGIGFDINTKKKGIGLKNIRSRATKLGGELNITSQKNKGTSIHIQVPFKIIVKNEETV